MDSHTSEWPETTPAGPYGKIIMAHGHGGGYLVCSTVNFMPCYFGPLRSLDFWGVTFNLLCVVHVVSVGKGACTLVACGPRPLPRVAMTICTHLPVPTKAKNHIKIIHALSLVGELQLDTGHFPVDSWCFIQESMALALAYFFHPHYVRFGKTNLTYIHTFHQQRNRRPATKGIISSHDGGTK